MKWVLIGTGIVVVGIALSADFLYDKTSKMIGEAINEYHDGFR